MTAIDPLALIHRQLGASAEVTRRAAEACGPAIAAAAGLLVDVFRAGGQLLLCGNGGSAANCQHLASELVSALNHRTPRPALPAIALTTDTSVLTASSNDFGFEGVFERQVEALGRPGDALLGISTSGRSRNVLLALQRARARGMRTVLLSSEMGVDLDAVEIAIPVPSSDIQRIQETHLVIGHVICELLERQLFPGFRERNP